MTPTRAECITYAQMLSGDPTGAFLVDNASPSAGQINLGLCLEGAYREMVTTFDYYQLPAARFTYWYNLPAFTSQFTPSQAGLTNFQEPIGLEERIPATTVAISGASNSTPIRITTASPHGLGAANATTGELIVSGVNGQTGANGRWFGTVFDASNIDLNGSVTVAAFSASPNALLTTSTDSYNTVKQLTELPQRVPDLRLWVYTFDNQTFRFIGATQAMELKLDYYASGSPPATGSLGYDDCKDFISYRAASIACQIMGNARAPQLAADAQQYLKFLVDQALREQQRNPIRPRAYRSGGYLRPTTLNPSGAILP